MHIKNVFFQLRAMTDLRDTDRHKFTTAFFFAPRLRLISRDSGSPKLLRNLRTGNACLVTHYTTAEALPVDHILCVNSAKRLPDHWGEKQPNKKATETATTTTTTTAPKKETTTNQTNQQTKPPTQRTENNDQPALNLSSSSHAQYTESDD